VVSSSDPKRLPGRKSQEAGKVANKNTAGDLWQSIKIRNGS